MTCDPSPMSRITAIEVQKRRGERRSIYVDDEFVAGVDLEVVVKLGLKVGQQVDTERLEEILRIEELRKARECALTFLEYRARTGKELERKLLQKGYSEEVVAQVLDQLEDIDLVDDERFAADWVASRVEHRPMGRTRMTWELRRKGVAADAIEEALEQIDEETEFDMALEIARKKLGSSSAADPDVRRKLAGFLQRRGFRWEIVSRILDRLAPEE